MPTTANGLKATAVRGASWIYLVESPTLVEAIEVKPGLRIEDIDTRAIPAPGFENWTFATHLAARKLGRRDCNEGAEPGWYVHTDGGDWYGPIDTKADAVRSVRDDLAKLKNWYWPHTYSIDADGSTTAGTEKD